MGSTETERVDKLAYYLLKGVNKAIRQYRMVADGDRVLIAVSGGKDSLTLLDLLWRRRATSREHYGLVAGLIRGDVPCGRSVPIPWLEAWCEERRIPFHIADVAMAEDLASTTLSKCFRCTQNRRKALFLMADRLGCTKLAFGHHADDIAETTLLNLFYAGRFSRMEPKVTLFQGRLVLIRPLALVEQRDILPFVLASGYPIEGEPCPEGVDSRRALVRDILRQLESQSHDVKRHIYRAVEHVRERMRYEEVEDQPPEDAKGGLGV